MTSTDDPGGGASGQDEPTAGEEAMLRRLAAALGPDPMPAGMLERADALVEVLDLDRDLLALLDEATLVGTRSTSPAATGAPLVLALADGTLRLELEVVTGQVRGQLLGATDPTDPTDPTVEADPAEAVVALERPDGTRMPVLLDLLDRFVLAPVPSGPVRLAVRRADGRVAVTDWLLLERAAGR